MKTKQLKEFFEARGFNVSLYKQEGKQCAELESWTDGGVDMIINLNPFTVEEFNYFVRNFDVDDEIDLHRQDKRYRDAFRISQSVEDFIKYDIFLQDVYLQLP